MLSRRRRCRTSFPVLALALFFSSTLFLANAQRASAELMDFSGTLTTTLLGGVSVSTPISGQVNVIGEIPGSTLVIHFASGVITQMASDTYGTVNLQNAAGSFAFRTAPEATRRYTLSTVTTYYSYPVSYSYARYYAQVIDNYGGFGGPLPMVGTIQTGMETLSPVGFGWVGSYPPSSAFLSWGAGTATVNEARYARSSYFIYIPSSPSADGTYPGRFSRLPGLAGTYPVTSTTVMGGGLPTEASGQISVSLVAPMIFKRDARSGISAYHVGVAQLDLLLVPEPGPALLISASALMLAVLSWGRRKN